MAQKNPIRPSGVVTLSVLIPDRDPTCAAKGDALLESEGARVIVTPLMAPKANAHAERWVGSCRCECLDWMLIVNRAHLEAVPREYCKHYNKERAPSDPQPTTARCPRRSHNSREGGSGRALGSEAY